MTTPIALILDAVASRIDAAGLGYWNPTGAYPALPERPPVYGKRFPPKAPQTAVSVNVYGIHVSPDPNLDVEVFRLQVRTRAPINADPLADRILTLLHGKHHEQWGALKIQRCQHLSTAQLGVDTESLDERTDNYQVEVLSG